MIENNSLPNLVFETSWEVCNKVGGIYTVLTSRAKTLQDILGKDKLVFIGPDIWKDKENPDFKEDTALLPAWREKVEAEGLACRIGRWQIEGQPLCVLVDFQPFFEKKNEIFGEAWAQSHVDSLHAYGDYDESSMFSYAAARFVEAVAPDMLAAGQRIVYQAHEWMSGLGMLRLGHTMPQIATIFTTHATSIGRSIAGNDKLLYKYFEGYQGDQMAAELGVEAKHSVEKQSAWQADCFTTVSTFTDRECRQLLDKGADVILPNGFDSTIVPAGAAFTKVRRTARGRLLDVAGALLGEKLAADTFIISTSGRNDYRCKGFDVYLESMAQLSAKLRDAGEARTRVLALVEVPCWVDEPREDLLERLALPTVADGPLPHPFLTHTLHNFGDDRLVKTIRGLALWNEPSDPVKVMLIPCYLDGRDGIVNLPYYDALTASDLCVYPSYYEPWGYTPLEAAAFHTPCITTDLSGFGQWVSTTLGRDAAISDGVAVLHRDDNNYFALAAEIADIAQQLIQTDKARISAYRTAAAKLARKAQWTDFIGHYLEAYRFALNKKR